MTEIALQVANYNIDFWVEGVWYPAAVDMNFEVQAGKVLAIVGESGSGKTVMSRAAAASSKAASNRLLPGGFECQDFLHGERAELLDAARVRAAQKVK